MPTTFKTEKIDTNYYIDLTLKEMEAILDYDGVVYNVPLVNMLEDIDGVRNVECDGHFVICDGAHLFLTIRTEEDNKATWDKIFSAISKACNK